MKYIELFAGIGGFRSALDVLGMKCVFASEIDKYATQSYKALYGGEELHGDITKIEAVDIPDHDLLVGGFPCQTFSIAGQKKGFEDARGTLFFEIARIASDKKPKWLLLENVKGLLSHDEGRTFDTMCQILNDIGYAIDFDLLNSKYFNIPQSRERVFIVANRDVEQEDWSFSGLDLVAKAKKRIQKLGVKTFNFSFPSYNYATKNLKSVLQEKVPEKYYLTPEKTSLLIQKLNGVSLTNFQDTEPYLDCVGRVELNGHDFLKRVYNAEGLSPTIETMGGGNREPKIALREFGKDGYSIRKLTPRECFRLQGFTDEQFDKLIEAGLSDTQLYKQAGNAVTVNVISELGKLIIAYDSNNTCECCWKGSSELFELEGCFMCENCYMYNLGV
jgi:DNA (cytosine-5)-methyltransferase 1